MVKKAKVCRKHMKPQPCFSKLRNKILGFRYPVEFLALPHNNRLSAAVALEVVECSPSGGSCIPLYSELRRFFYSFLNVFTLAEFVPRRANPQHLVAYPQPYQHVDKFPRKRQDQAEKILRHQDRF